MRRFSPGSRAVGRRAFLLLGIASVSACAANDVGRERASPRYTGRPPSATADSGLAAANESLRACGLSAESILSPNAAVLVGVRCLVIGEGESTALARYLDPAEEALQFAARDLKLRVPQMRVPIIASRSTQVRNAILRQLAVRPPDMTRSYLTGWVGENPPFVMITPGIEDGVVGGDSRPISARVVLRQLMGHELTHVLTFKDRRPVAGVSSWLTEGYAEMVGYDLMGSGVTATNLRGSPQVSAWSWPGTKWAAGWEYEASWTICSFIESSWSREALRGLYTSAFYLDPSGPQFDMACQQSLGVGLAELRRRWLAWIGARS